MIEIPDNFENEPKLNDPDIGLEHMVNANKLDESFNKCKSNTSWKGSVQRFEMNKLSNYRELQKEIRNDNYTQMPMTEFKQSERGKDREIKAHHIRDRVVQRSLNDNILLPRIDSHLIYDNGASRINKGLSFARERFEKHLHQAYFNYGSSAYVLLMDFSKFFDNILHNNLINLYANYLSAPELNFVIKCIKEFEVDVSYLSDEEYQNYENILFNSLEYSQIPKELRSSGEKMMPKSMGIGSQTSQISGLLYPSPIDHYCKTVLSLKYYGRYMDDTYIIMNDKDKLKNLLNNILIPMYNSYGIFINLKKTHIENIMNQITFLKINYTMQESGRLIRTISNSTIRREQRRILILKKLYDSRRISLENVINCYRSWKYNYIKYDSGSHIHKLDILFCSIFNLPIEATKRNIRTRDLLKDLHLLP